MLYFNFSIYYFILEYKRKKLIIKDIITFFYTITTIFHHKTLYINYFNKKLKFINLKI